MPSNINPIAAKAKGHRMQHLRNLTGLSRQEFCDKHKINRRTLKSWELGDYKGIPKNSAIKVLATYFEEGVQCELQWLMHGTGQPPTLTQKKQIEKEIEMFKQNNPDYIILLINDSSMEPYFYPKDYVAGVKRKGKDIQNLIGLNCIIETTDEQVLLRHLEAGSKKDHYTISCANQTLKDVLLKSAAQVIWMRREELPAKSS
ncbi:MAG: hypothetical protein PVG30_05930 [Gammaproteobacteria bacterium]